MGRPFNDKTGTLFHYSRLSLREWFIIVLLFLGLHNSSLGLSWLMDRSYMTTFRAVKRLMLRLREKTQSVKMDRTIEVDEVYVTAVLKEAGYHHEAVNHSVEEWVRDEANTNGSKGIKPVEVIKEILKIVFIFMAFLAILKRSCFSPKSHKRLTGLVEKPSHFTLFV